MQHPILRNGAFRKASSLLIPEIFDVIRNDLFCRKLVLGKDYHMNREIAVMSCYQ